MAKKVIFTIDWECWNSFDQNNKWNAYEHIDEPTYYLLDLLRRHQIRAIFYCVGWLFSKRQDLVELIKKEGHTVGNHTFFHDKGEVALWRKLDNVIFRAPRWHGEKRLYSGGFWFRAMPYNWVKKEVEKTGIFFIHPHDVLLEHPECGIRTFDRRLGLKTSRDKLERLCREVTWNEP